MSKMLLYRFYNLEDFINSLAKIEKEAEDYTKKIPNLTTEVRTSISEKDYFIELYIADETED